MIKAISSYVVGKLALTQSSFDNPLNPFDPIVVGNNTCYMSTGYYPKEDLTKILPDLMTIPSDEQMHGLYPDTELVDG